MEVENIFEYYLNIAQRVQKFLKSENTLPNKIELVEPLGKLKRMYHSLFENEGLIISYIQFMSDRINDPNQQAQALLELEMQSKTNYLEKKQDNVDTIMPEVKNLMARLQDTTQSALSKDGKITFVTSMMLESQMHSKQLGEIDIIIKELLPENESVHYNLPAPPTMEFLDKTFNDMSRSMTKVMTIALDKNIPEINNKTKLQNAMSQLREEYYNHNKNGFKNDH